MTNRLLILVLLLSIFTSCRQNKELIYLQGIDPITKGNQLKEKIYKIRENDILSVQILSMSKDIMEVFNGVITQSVQNNYNDASLYFQGYSVNDSGFVKLPIIGNVSVKDLTVKEAENLIQKKADEFIKDATVMVRLADFKITVLGEVKMPGTYYIYNNQENIFELLGKAGDITDYGNRKNVMIVRQTKDGTATFRIDLTDKNSVISDSYYLLPNDIVYVEPRKNKSIKLITSDYSLIITTLVSTLTSLVLIVSLLKL
ncbi:MAG: polysaccharide biosynthesis/export family protein [Bacteroidia bacterium]|nr:polysaccharide biosynthesis/export family protein [Bacteroidia bacterium]